MNLTPHRNEKDMDQLRTEQVQKKKNEFHLIGQERRIKGHTLFCFNLVKREIKVAPMNQEIEMGLDGSVIVQNCDDKNITPTALDVYRGKTTLEITYRDSVAIDSTVVYKVR